MKNYKNTLQLKYEPYKFVNRENAFKWANNSLKPQRVMLGCDGRFWVVCPADAARLEKLDYEYAI